MSQNLDLKIKYLKDNTLAKLAMNKICASDFGYYHTGGHRYKITAVLDDPAVTTGGILKSFFGLGFPILTHN